MAPPDPIEPGNTRYPAPADRHGDGRAEIGVIDLTSRMRPVGGRRSSRQTHTRLIAALARIQATTAAERSTAEPARAGCGSDR